MSERSYDPPETCSICDKYHVFRHGRCYECEQSAIEARGEERRERKAEQERERND